MPTARQQLELWKTRLLDLSRRNRLLHTRPNLPGTVPLTHPAPAELFDALVRRRRLLGFASALTLEQQLAALSWDAPATGATVRLDQLTAPPPKPGQLATGLPPADQERALYGLRLRARTALSEQGLSVLYVALGFLEWFDPAAGEAIWRSPLLLLPVELQRATLGAEYTLRLTDDEVVLNPTLVHKLRQDFGVALPELPEDADDLEIEPFFAAVEALITGRDGWQVAREALLGLFSFQKLLMYHDLERAAESPTPHPIVARLAGEAELRTRNEELRKTSGQESNSQFPLDARPPEHSYQVLDADSSQAEAIAAARAGASFVLQGPPGTGKSQTIANIIAECLAAGQRVLFVSEKMAALQVVYERLRQAGLDEFCLELHSHKAGKRAVLDALGASLSAAAPPIDPAFPYAELAATRDQLNEYAHALHAPHGPLRWTPFLVHGRVAALADAPDTAAPVGDPDSFTAERLGAADALLVRLDTRSELLQSMPANVWRGCSITVSSFEQRGRIRAQLRALVAALHDLEPVAAAAAAPLGLPVPETLAGARALAALLELLGAPGQAPPEWLADAGRAAARPALIADARAHYAGLADLEQRVFARYQPALLDLDIDGLLDRFTHQHTSWARALRPQYHRDMAALRGALAPGASLAPDQAAEDLRLAAELRAARVWADQHGAELAQQLAPWFDGGATDWDRLAASADWAARLLALDLVRPLPSALVAAAGQPPSQRAHLSSASRTLAATLSKLDGELASFQELGIESAVLRREVIDRAEFSILHSQFSILLERMGDLDAWWEYYELRRAAEPIGLAEYLDALSADPAAAAQPRRAFHKRLCALWLDAAYDRAPVLRQFQRAPYEALVERFRTLDREQLAAAQVRLHRLLAGRRPATSAPAAPGSELGLLRRELQKQRRHKPIRQLFREIPSLLGQLKPCLMMSPLSVSQFLELDAAPFDLVIFDEASQIRAEDAIGAVLRGRALIVVGDDKQLPPTSFFVAGDAEADDVDDSAESYESILDAAGAAGLEARLLRWHYRSRAEALITFSNGQFYGGQLATFPSAASPPDRGVRLEHVPDAIYDRQASRANPAEASRAADLVVAHLRATPERSLGLVAFSQPQQLAILHELERRRAADDTLAPLFDEARPEPFFVKNLENVQGDERDVMIVSVGYGRDAAGRVLMNFGPLNQQGGERRLNVAITRAREQVILVSSLLPEDIDTRRTQHPGPRLLREYLEYARRGGPGPSPGEQAAAGGSAPAIAYRAAPLASDRFENRLAVALARRGLVLARQIGHSGFRIDIAVRDPRDPARFILGVECDGDDYRDAPTARDRERLREQVLATLGWRIHRAWSAAWARDPAAEIDRVLAALDAISAEPAVS